MRVHDRTYPRYPHLKYHYRVAYVTADAGIYQAAW